MRVRAPAGLDLGHLPHPEIAVAILADIVAEKARSMPVLRSVRLEAVDPVCGMTVDTTRAPDEVEHDGVVYRFCGAACRRRFQAEPSAFLVKES